jgi:hypothetical protein
MLIKHLWLVIIATLPLIAGAGLVLFMASGKGKPRPTQTELEERLKVQSDGGKEPE